MEIRAEIAIDRSPEMASCHSSRPNAASASPTRAQTSGRNSSLLQNPSAPRIFARGFLAKRVGDP
jgi:hypothetical protein